jgi:hypothetical protein
LFLVQLFQSRLSPSCRERGKETGTKNTANQ